MKNSVEKVNAFHQKHPKARKVLKGVTYIFSEKILKFSIGFIVHALVARHLGPEQFGKLSYIIKTVNVFYVFSLFGVDEIVVKHLLDKNLNHQDVLKTVFRLRLGMSFIGLFFLGLFLLIAKPEGNHFTLLTFFYGLQMILQAFNVFELVFQARLSFRPLFWANNISNIFSSGLRYLGVYLKLGIPYFVTTYLAGEFLLKGIILWRLGFKIFSGRYLPDLARTLAKSSWPHFLAAFVVLLDQRISFVFIEEYLKDVALGNYSVAVTLVDLWIFLPVAVCSALFPTIVSAFNDNKKAYETRIQYLADMMVWIAILFSFGVFLSADLIIDVLYGVKYMSAPEIIRWYALVTIPIFFNLARIKWMSLENQLVDWLKLSALGLVINLVLHYWLVPLFGVKGAVWSFLISQIAANLIGRAFLQSVNKALKIFLRTFHFPINVYNKLR